MKPSSDIKIKNKRKPILKNKTKANRLVNQEKFDTSQYKNDYNEDISKNSKLLQSDDQTSKIISQTRSP